MDRIYILSAIYFKENCATLRNTEHSEMYPQAAGTKEAVEKELNRRIQLSKFKGCTIEEISSEDIHKGQYFDKVIKINRGTQQGPEVYGISSVWKVN